MSVYSKTILYSFKLVYSKTILYSLKLVYSKTILYSLKLVYSKTVLCSAQHSLLLPVSAYCGIPMQLLFDTLLMLYITDIVLYQYLYTHSEVYV